MSNQTNLPSDHLLPEEIWNLILLKLPIKSILICTAVCKSWNSLIKSASFISSHLNHSISDSNPLFFLRYVDLKSAPQTDRFSLHLDDDDLTKHTSLNFPCRFRNPMYLLGCCNGLVFIGEQLSFNLYLWNPNLRKLVMLPPRDWYSFGGLGFDSNTNDYKALVISSVDPFKISLYSLNSNSWQWSRDVPIQSKYSTFAVESGNSMTFLNGNFHLDAQSNLGGLFVLAFDMYDGACSEIMLPSCFTATPFKKFNNSVNVCAGLLSVFLASVYNDFYEIWVMKEYGVEASWTQIAKFRRPCMISIVTCPLMLSFRKNGDVIMAVGAEMVLYNIRDNVIKNVKIQGQGEDHSFFVDSYVESLALLGRRDGLRGEWMDLDES